MNNWRNLDSENDRDGDFFFKTKVALASDYYYWVIQIHLSVPNCHNINCQIGVSRQTNFEDHLEEHKVGLGTKLFSCNICDTKFHLRTSLRRHLKAHENDTEDTLCSICGITVETKNEMRKHKRKHHNNLPIKKKKMESNPLVEYNCKFCEFEWFLEE